MWRTFCPRADDPFCHHARFQITPDQFQYPFIFDLPRYPRHENVVVHPIKEFLQIEVDHPAAAFLDIALRSLHRLPCIAARSEPVAMCGEFGIELWLQNLQQCLLDQSIQYRRDAQCAYPAIGLGYVHFANRRRHVFARQKCCLDAWPVLLQPCLELVHGEPIDSCRALVPHVPLIRSPEVATFDYGVHLPQSFRFRLPIRRRANLSAPPGY